MGLWGIVMLLKKKFMRKLITSCMGLLCTAFVYAQQDTSIKALEIDSKMEMVFGKNASEIKSSYFLGILDKIRMIRKEFSNFGGIVTIPGLFKPQLLYCTCVCTPVGTYR